MRFFLIPLFLFFILVVCCWADAEESPCDGCVGGGRGDKFLSRYESFNKIVDFVCEISNLDETDCKTIRKLSFDQVFGEAPKDPLEYENCRHDFERFKLYEVIESFVGKDNNNIKFPDEFGIKILKKGSCIETLRADYCFGFLCQKTEIAFMIPCIPCISVTGPFIHISFDQMYQEIQDKILNDLMFELTMLERKQQFNNLTIIEQFNKQ
jgi:hypothetical protein